MESSNGVQRPFHPRHESAAATTRRPSRAPSPRGPAALYLALTAVLVVLVAALAFTTRQPPPPQIAELTPQAQHQITKAPNQLSSSIGAATGGRCTGAAPCGLGNGPGGGSGTSLPSPTTPAGAPKIIDAAAAHHCYGNPPRQISFDTQSPPCVAYWAGDNGGATSMGVTGNQITVLTPDFADPSSSRVTQDLFAFFNRTFELYGRRMVPEGSNAGGGSCSSDTAMADGYVSQYQPFATVSSDTSGGICYRTEMARKHVISTGLREWIPQPVAASYAPYMWSYAMSGEGQMANIGAFVCAQLAGKKASYSPDPTIASRTRVFGLIHLYDSTPYPLGASSLQNALGGCGVKLAAKESYAATGDNAADEEFSSNAVLAMKEANVTTVICICDTTDMEEVFIPPAADSQHYYPEWLLPFSNANNYQIELEWHDPAQQKALIGMTFKPAQVPIPSMTLNEALNAVDPGYQDNSNKTGQVYYDQRFYWELLLIASGIQMAGPDLTPYTFERGLQLAHFPNPYSPEMEGMVGFNGGSFYMTTDAAVMWWSNTAVGPYADNGNGAWCYVDGGERFSVAKGNWSKPMNLFELTGCDSSPPGS